VAAVVWGVFGIAGFGLQSWFHSNAHFVSAGAFFILVSLVAWIEAIRQVRRSPDSEGDNRRRRAYIVAYGAIGIVLFVNIVAAAVIILVQRGSNPGFAPIGVFVVEVIGLTLFAAFFALQTFDHRHDGDGWGALPPSRKERRRFQPAI
jgi:membrane protease YdiL (CAAX protease family)